jgi:site-specific DNA recombinase
MKLICISRVSDKEQRDALGGQELKLHHYAAKIDLNAEYHRFDESAHHDERKKFAKLVEHIKQRAQKELIGLVFCKVDRYTRGSSDQSEVKALNDLVRAGKIELHFCDDGLIVTKDSPATDLFRLGINVALAKYYSDTIRENVARRYAQMLHEKTWVGRAPLGYLNVNEGTLKKPDKNIIVDDERSLHIITMFEKRALGMPYDTIAKLATEAGLRSKSDKKLGKSNIEQILNNSFYYGTMVFMGKSYPHKYPTLITKDLYEKCQRVRVERHRNRTVYKSIPFVFNTFVRCAECKCMISSYIARNNVYLKCSKAKYKECKNVSTAQKLLMPQVEAILRSIALSDENLEKLIDLVKDKYGNQQQFVDNAVKTTREEHDSITEQLKTLTYERLEAVKLGKGISAELYDEIVDELTEKQQKLTSKLSKLVDYNKSYLTTASHLLDLGQRANQLFNTANPFQQQQILKGLVYNVEMFDQKLSYSLINCYEAFKQLNETSQSDLNDSSWCPRQDSNLRP